MIRKRRVAKLMRRHFLQRKDWMIYKSFKKSSKEKEKREKLNNKGLESKSSKRKEDSKNKRTELPNKSNKG